MIDSGQKKELIWAHEKRFTADLANQILHKPRLNAWMVLIPFIFIFYFQDLSKYKQQRQEFMEHYLLSRKKALAEAEEALDQSRKPDPGALAEKADLNDRSTEKYRRFLAVLIEHYTGLLQARGDSFKALVRDCYGGKRHNYLLFLNQLNSAEKELNQALQPTIETDDRKEIARTIKNMETWSEKIRRREMEEFYS